MANTLEGERRVCIPRDGEYGQASDLDRAAQDSHLVPLAPLLISGRAGFVPISKLKKT